MNEDLIKIDNDFLEILNKHLINIPEFKTGNEFLDLTKRLEYTSKNNSIETELKEYISENNLKSDNINFLFRFYIKKYNYGFNFPSAIEIYTSLLQNHQ